MNEVTDQQTTIKPPYALQLERESGGLLEIKLAEIPPDLAVQFLHLERMAILGRVPCLAMLNPFSGRYMALVALEDLSSLIDPTPTPTHRYAPSDTDWLAVCTPDQMEDPDW